MSLSIQAIRKSFFCLMIACYFLQVPFRPLSSFITVFAFAFISTGWKSWIQLFRRPVYCLYCLYICLGILVATFSEDFQIQKVVRFGAILLVTPLFFSVQNINDKRFYVQAFIRIAFLKAVFLFVIYGLVVKSGSFGAVRSYVHLHGWGDVYSFGSMVFTRVQFHGNALLVFACFLSFYTKSRLIYRIALLLGCLVAGNKAFLIGLFLFLVYFCLIWMLRYARKTEFNLKICFLYLSMLICMPFLVKESIKILESKADYSNVIRLDQAKVLLSGNIMTGNGVGNVIKAETTFRNYANNNYFELQSLYIINQIGILGYFLFMVLTFSLCLSCKNGIDLAFFYFSYLAYTFFNPYCFDTTHMIVGFLLCTVLGVPKGRER